MVQVREAGRKVKWPELQKLEEQIRNTSQNAVARELGVSPVSVHKHIKRERLRLSTGYTQVRLSCRDCGVSFDGTNTYKSDRAIYCKTCSNQRKVEALRRRKIQIVEYLGGSCARCGYDRYVGALHIHHKDPTKKDQNFRHHRNWSWQKLEKELVSCELLCANCHAEEHGFSYAGLV